MKKLIKYLITFGGCLLLAPSLKAAPVVSVQFARQTDNTAALPLSYSAVTGVQPVANWNGITLSSGGGTITGLIDSTGASAGGSITYGSSWGNDVNVSAASTQPNLTLFSGYTYGSPTLSINSSPYTNYDLYVYFSGFNGGTGSLSCGSTTYYYQPFNYYLSSGPITFTQATSTVSTSTPSANYALFTNLSGPVTITNTLTAAGGAGGGIVGLQFIPHQVAINDNTAPPYMGVSEGSVNGISNPYGINQLTTYTAWLNRTMVFGNGGLPADWTNIEGQSWILQPWGQWVQSTGQWAGQDPHHHRIFILGVPMLPGSGSVPLSGTSLALGATGAYNSHFQNLAQHLVSNGLGNSIIRLGWEWNGNWYPWHVSTDADAVNFAAYWRQIVTTMRAVSGASNLKFDWNVSNNVYMSYPAADAYPGNSYVDYIGDDVYDANFNGYYPWPAGSSQATILQRHQWAWQYATYPNAQFGIAYWHAFANSVSKPLTFPEWGLAANRSDNCGGQDDPYFIQQMFNYIQQPSNNIYYAAYFDVNGGTSAGDSRISPAENPPPAAPICPNSSALFQQLFGFHAVFTLFQDGVNNVAWNAGWGTYSQTVVGTDGTYAPYEGAEQYKITYTTTAETGFGFASTNLSTANYLRLAVEGPLTNSTDTLLVRILDTNNVSSGYVSIPRTTNYNLIDIPMSSFSAVDKTKIDRICIYPQPTTSGISDYYYIDNILFH